MMKYGIVLSFVSSIALAQSDFEKKFCVDVRSCPPFLKDFSLSTIRGQLGDGVVIPVSRSLQKKVVDFKNPRIVTGSDRTFFGYAKNTDQAEIISWNQSNGNYDFFVIENFSTAPKLVRPEKSSCTRCHFNEGPILTHAPWGETQENVGILKKLCLEFPSGEYLGFKFIQSLGGNTTCKDILALGEKLDPQSFFQSNAKVVDAHIRHASYAIRQRSACQYFIDHVCKQNTESCYKELLYASLLFSIENDIYSHNHWSNISKYQQTFFRRNDHEKLKFIQDLEKKYRLDDTIPSFQTPSSVLPDFDPLDKGAVLMVANKTAFTDIPLSKHDPRISEVFEEQLAGSAFLGSKPNQRMRIPLTASVRYDFISPEGEAPPMTPPVKKEDYFEFVSRSASSCWNIRSINISDLEKCTPAELKKMVNDLKGVTSFDKNLILGQEVSKLVLRCKGARSSFEEIEKTH